MNSDQINFLENDRYTFENSVLSILKKIINDKYGFGEFVILRENKDSTSILFIKNVAFNFIKVRNKTYIKVDKFNIPEGFNLDFYQIKSDPDKYRIKLDCPEDILIMKNTFLNMFYQSMGNDFDCCSRYLDCSDNIKCTQPDKTLSLGCSYLKKLLDSKIIYGKNKTI